MVKLEKKIYEILTKSRKPLNRNEIAKRAGEYHQGRRSRAVSGALGKMVGSGAIVENRGRYALARDSSLVEAEIVKVAGTFGFATPLSEGASDIFIPGRHLMGAMPGDIVMVSKSTRSGGQLEEGQVSRILKEANHPFAGLLVREEYTGKFMVIPDQYAGFPMQLSGPAPSGAMEGEKILAQVVQRGQRHSQHKVELVQIFGDAQKASVCAEAILAENNITREFSDQAMEQARAIGSGVGIHPKELAAREDLRGWNIFTIDGADTKDIDDAISLVSTENGWQLGVHIADVSYFVTRQSPLDEDAFQRGTSVYYADQVVPMLPPELSNGICSLNPEEDRLAFSAIISLGHDGELLSYRFTKTVINSRIKGVYSEINQLLAGTADSTLTQKYKDQLDILKNMAALAAIIHTKRMARNSVNLESKESKIIVGADGSIVDIVPRESGVSENMIEEFMLTANEAAATYAQLEKLPFIYRVHEPPSPDRLENFFALMDNLGVAYSPVKPGLSPAKTMNDILDSLRDTPLFGVVNYSLLRTMSKAKYSESNLGHFGLGLSNYAHFTSPIRRYPDLAIHRILSAKITGMRTDNIEKHFSGWTKITSTQSSAREMASMTAERTATDCYHAEYISRFIGEEFLGIVSSTTSFGLFVQLENTVEGLIHMNNLPAGRWFYDDLITYQNDVGGAKIRVGDQLKIRITSTDIPAGRIDFELAEPNLYTPAAK